MKGAARLRSEGESPLVLSRQKAQMQLFQDDGRPVGMQRVKTRVYGKHVYAKVPGRIEARLI